MNFPIFQVDAFTESLFSGNPAAVVICEKPLSSQVMQSIAAENNLSETAFVVSSGSRHRIRWFTPTIEVDLCGHATLAAAHVFFNHLDFQESWISFDSRSGLLHVRKEDEILYLDFPADTLRRTEALPQLVKGLGTDPIELYRGRDDYLAVFENEEIIASLCPDMAVMAQVPSRGVIVSAAGDHVDFVSRFFAPQSGVPEDPVTGSAHTTLIPYWSEKLSKQSLEARQISRRGGSLLCKNLGSRVEIGGRAITYLSGEIRLKGE